MKLHDKSCMLDSFCMVLGIEHAEAVGYLGHDGSEYGFHSQELIDLADFHGYSVTEIQRQPLATHPETWESIKINFLEGNDSRFARHMFGHIGVLMGMKLGRTHAVAWESVEAIDPANNLRYRLLNKNRELIEDIFAPYVFLKVEA